MNFKQVIREAKISQLQATSIKKRKFASQITTNNLICWNKFKLSKNIASYCSFDWELDTSNINKFILSNKKLLLPKMVGNKINLALVNQSTYMKKGIYNFCEPDAVNYFPIKAVDMILLPLVAYDSKGVRVGRGSAHYDRLLSKLANKRPIIVGVGYTWQQCKFVQKDKWDITCDYIANEQGIMTCQST